MWWRKLLHHKIRVIFRYFSYGYYKYIKWPKTVFSDGNRGCGDAQGEKIPDAYFIAVFGFKLVEIKNTLLGVG